MPTQGLQHCFSSLSGVEQVSQATWAWVMVQGKLTPGFQVSGTNDVCSLRTSDPAKHSREQQNHCRPAHYLPSWSSATRSCKVPFPVQSKDPKQAGLGGW